MCLAVPMRLKERQGSLGIVELDGVERTVSLMLLPEAAVGEYLLVHAGYAIGSVDEEEAMATLELLRQVAAAEPGGPSRVRRERAEMPMMAGARRGEQGSRTWKVRRHPANPEYARQRGTIRPRSRNRLGLPG